MSQIIFTVNVRSELISIPLQSLPLYLRPPLLNCVPGNFARMKLLSLTTLREMARLSLPMVVNHGSFAVMVFSDRWFLAQIDSVHVAAAMGGGVAMFFCVSFFIGLITYANALLSLIHI